MKTLKLLTSLLESEEQALRMTGRTTRIMNNISKDDYVIVHRHCFGKEYIANGASPDKILVANDLLQLQSAIRGLPTERNFKIFIDNYAEYVIIANSLNSIMNVYKDLDYVVENITYKGEDIL